MAAERSIIDSSSRSKSSSTVVVIGIVVIILVEVPEIVTATVLPVLWINEGLSYLILSYS